MFLCGKPCIKRLDGTGRVVRTEDWGLGRGCPFVGQAAGGSSRGEGDEWFGGGGALHITLTDHGLKFSLAGKR